MKKVCSIVVILLIALMVGCATVSQMPVTPSGDLVEQLRGALIEQENGHRGLGFVREYSPGLNVLCAVVEIEGLLKWSVVNLQMEGTIVMFEMADKETLWLEVGITHDCWIEDGSFKYNYEPVGGNYVTWESLKANEDWIKDVNLLLESKMTATQAGMVYYEILPPEFKGLTGA